MLGELIGRTSSTVNRLESGVRMNEDVVVTLKFIKALRLSKRQAENMIEAARFSPRVIDIILNYQK